MPQTPHARPLPTRLHLACLLSLGGTLAAATAPLHAQAAEPPALPLPAIASVTVYPDSALVERSLALPGGTRTLVLPCLPASVDPASLQVDGDAGLRLGDIRSEPVLATDAAACNTRPADARLRELQARRDALEARSKSNASALALLDRWNPSVELLGGKPTAAPAGRPASPADAAQALRETALKLQTEQLQLQREAADVAAALAALPGGNNRGNSGGAWKRVQLTVYTPTAATVRLRYPVGGVHWRPAYRAVLDSAGGHVQLERLAQVQQGSGEDWTGVRLTLSTGQPNSRAAGPLPEPWQVGVEEPRPVSVMAKAARLRESADLAPSMLRASVAMAAPAPASPVDQPPPEFELAETEIGTEFRLDGPVSLPSDRQQHALTLGSQRLPAQVLTQVSPREDATAYVLAEAARPVGVWLRGELQTWRDGSLVGRTPWAPADGEQLRLPFGRDDRMQVRVETPPPSATRSGLFDPTTERRWQRAYVITSQHTAPRALRVLDALPVSTDSRVQVSSQLQPVPAVTDWDHQKGIAAWTLRLAPGQTQRIEVEHRAKAGKDIVISGWPE